MKRRFYLNRSEHIPGRSSKAWTVGGILERVDGKNVLGCMEVSIMGASKYDALCTLDDRLKMWGVTPEDIFTA